MQKQFTNEDKDILSTPLIRISNYDTLLVTIRWQNIYKEN